VLFLYFVLGVELKKGGCVFWGRSITTCLKYGICWWEVAEQLLVTRGSWVCRHSEN